MGIVAMIKQDAKITAVYCLAEAPDGTIYAGTGPQGLVVAVKGDKVSTIADMEDANIFSLLIDADGKLLIGTGGEKGRILRLDKPDQKPVEIFAAEGVQYVWKMVQTSDGMLYAATGPNGQLFEIKPDGSKSVLLDSDENNLLSMIGDGKDLLYVGTDPNGLVYRVNRKTKDVFVLYDAAESEISALALDRDGNLYAGTGQAADNDEARDLIADQHLIADGDGVLHAVETLGHLEVER
jgi:ligand-binding sensor domain-containing protein